ncbi:MAG TPA: DUF72 domain-containing protein [Verrucomicrobiales bacterium]|nr:DUF72 domain-containing protein [Verrucomicrobiales bacterium]
MIADQLRPALRDLAARGIYIGTSSWKYPGWIGQIYTGERYQTRGKFSKAKFEATCLEEYAETFSTVCVDAGYYSFPTEQWLTGMAEQVPAGFRFAFKVTDEITIRRFPNLPRFGDRGGKENPHFLDAELFTRSFLKPMESIGDKAGPLIFEFSHFHPTEYKRGREFIDALDGFLSKIPKGPEYTVEVRNKTFLHPDYFAMLQSHGIPHCFNNWERMPPVSEQIAHTDSFTGDFTAARYLLTPGRKYEGAVKAFEPYAETRQVDQDARGSLVAILRHSLRKKRRGYFYVNNRLEGNAPNTIKAALKELLPKEPLHHVGSEAHYPLPERLAPGTPVWIVAFDGHGHCIVMDRTGKEWPVELINMS